MVTYIRSDLDFILDQIKIAEAHAAGQPLFGVGGLVPAYNLSYGLRTVDGTYNHLLPGQTTWGASDTQFPTLLDPAYRVTGIVADPDLGFGPFQTSAPNYNPTTGSSFATVIDPQIRTASNLTVDQTLANPAAVIHALQEAGYPTPNLATAQLVMALNEPVIPLARDFYLKDVTADAAEQKALFNVDPAQQGALNTAAANARNLASIAETALDAARVVRDAAVLSTYGIEMDGDNIVIKNVAPDEGLSASFNSWFTLFGQFFDHGLDLVNKGNSGIVFVPLSPDDPLYDADGADNIANSGDEKNFMVLTRATVLPGPDGKLGDDPTTPGVNESLDDIRPVNTTTSYVDQNQTYTSHPSHQVFLREYVLNVAGDPVATGKLIHGVNGGMATWADVKKQAAEKLGIILTDADVGSVPLIRTDAYGNFIPAVQGQALFGGGVANAAQAGMPQLIVGFGPDGIPNTTDDVVKVGSVATPANMTNVIKTDMAFLADIAHTAVPTGKIQDGDIEIGLANVIAGDSVADNYDNELLDAHFIAGDGRANENIGLTAVHHVFHSEHNRLVEHTKDVVLATQDLAFINEWLATPLANLTSIDTDVERTAFKANLTAWDGERLFQAAKFGTEMQYQHLVFEEFARKIQPQINPFVVPDGFDSSINPAIVAEFAHVVYRFGHSMLTETIDRYDASFTPDQIGLIEGFLNPIEFDNDGATAAGVAAGDIIRGMTRQVGNEIDEFVTSALRNNLLGLPLDLPTINMARGRDTGVPSLNAARREFFDMTNGAAEMKPYTSWVDFAGNLKNEASIINFIASYGKHLWITQETTLEGKRAAALAIILGTTQHVEGDPLNDLDDRDIVAPLDRIEFLNSTGPDWSNLAGGVTRTGLDDVDLWLGGLAEKILPFGGMLGSTFNFVFENQMESLQNGDRFYYLQRLDGLHLFGELEANSFAKMIMNNTNATHLPSDVFSTPGLILEVDQVKQFNGDLGSADPVGDSILTPLVIRDDPQTAGPDSYLRYTGEDHVLLGGNDLANTLIASIGDDTIYGDGGNDKMEGGAGNDIMNGGAGDDIIKDLGGDDNIKGDAGNDAINAGPGLDLVLGGDGQDFITLGTDAGGEVFGGTGNDFILGNKNAERILGNEGDDWLETGTFDGAPGDNFDEIFAMDKVNGHDVFFGDGGFDEFIGEGGDDIMVGSLGRGKMAGMSGWDWSTYKDSTFGIDADLTRAIVFDENPTPPPNGVLDTFEAVEGLSGSKFNDTLFGSNILAEERASFADGGSEGFQGSMLNAAGIARIAGLQGLMGSLTSYIAGDIILGGDGSDVMGGNWGDDILDGDMWLDVQIGVWNVGQPHTGTPPRTANSMKELTVEVFNGAINPGQLDIYRSIKLADGAGDVDVAVFSDVRANYLITDGGNGRVIVSHIAGTLLDGTDIVSHIERLRFADMEISTLPTDIKWNGITPASGSAFPVANAVLANLSSDFSGATFALVSGGPDFTVSAAGVVTRINTALAPNTVYTLQISATGGSGTYTETFNIRTGNNGNVVDTLTGLANDDVVYGNAGNDTLAGGDKDDTLFGQDGNDTLTGGNGNDVLNGGANNNTGADNMTGGNGDDTYYVDDVSGGAANSDSVTEAAGAGTGIDTVISTQTYTLGNNVENLTLFANNNNINGTGNTLDNVITGNNGDNVLTGLAGNDTYRIFSADGDDDEIVDSAGTTDRLVLVTGGAAFTALNFFDDDTGTNNGDLEIEYNNGDTISINDHFDNTNEQLEFINFDNGTYAGYAFGFGDYNLVRLDPASSGAPSARTVNVAAGNNLFAGETGADRIIAGAGNDLIWGDDGTDIIQSGAGNDLVLGGDGADNIDAGAGDDIIVYNIGDDNDTVNGGLGEDTLVILGDGDNETLSVVANGTVLTGVGSAGSAIGAITGVELVTADLGGGNDTLSYGATTTAVVVDLDAGTATGFESILNIENVTGGAGADTLTGDDLDNTLNGAGGIDTINAGAGDDDLLGGDGADILNADDGEDDITGGIGADIIDVGAVDDLEDIVRFSAVNEFGDTINNFESDAVNSIVDLVLLGGALNTAYDDGNNNNNILWDTNNGNGAVNTSAVGQGNGDIEALFLGGNNGEGVTNANLTSAAAVATAFNNEFQITAANGEDAFLLVNATNSDNASMWQWIQAAGGTAEIDVAELTLIGVINSNTTVAIDQFDFFG